MQWMTFDKWVESGYRVIKGQKSVLRQPDGKPLFSEEQVTPSNRDDWDMLDLDDDWGDRS